MRLLHPGQETILSWSAGAAECRVVAAAGHYVLLQPDPRSAPGVEEAAGTCSLTYLDGMVPMGWDGSVEPGGHPGELRFRVDGDLGADRRSSVRVPLFTSVTVTDGEQQLEGQLMDISAGGMRFRQPGRLAAGAALRVHAVLHEHLVVDADAVVRVAEPGVTSVEFTEMRGVSSQEIGAWTVSILRASLSGRG
jgi:hypothetical protein